MNRELAHEHLASLVAGYAPHRRARKPLAFLQAYIDDSACQTGKQRLFMGGFLNNTYGWSEFSRLWDRALSDYPEIKYLKMSEANALRGQFLGWSPEQRDQKLLRLFQLIRDTHSLSFEFTVDTSDYLDMVTPYAPHALGSPYYSTTFGIISSLVRYLESRGVEEKVDFIFDQQSNISSDIVLFFDYMCRNISPNARKLISGTPIFRDEKEMLPIQAADVLVWHLRREHEIGDVRQQLDFIIGCQIHLATHADEDSIRRMGQKMAVCIPEAAILNKKSKWQKMRKHLVRLMGSDYIPPHGTRFRNIFFGLIFGIRKWLRWLRR